MLQRIENRFFATLDGRPEGGHTYGPGLSIAWQRGPAGKDGQECNGCFVETVLQAAVARLEFFQASRFNHPLNAKAIESIRDALGHLGARTAERRERNVEGTYEV